MSLQNPGTPNKSILSSLSSQVSKKHTSRVGSHKEESQIKPAIKKSAESLIFVESDLAETNNLNNLKVVLFSVLDFIFGILFKLSEMFIKFTIQIFKKFSQMK